jgi:hypothetical protein
MTKSELNKFRNILEAKQAELVAFVRNREGIAIEKSPDALDEVQHAAERELAIFFGTCVPRCGASTKERSACACTARKTSAPSGWPRCHGRRSAFSARKWRIATKLATAPRVSTNCS